MGEPDYRELVESAGDIIYTLDLEGRFTYFNCAAARVLGYEPDELAELIGRPFTSILTAEGGRVATDHFLRSLGGEEMSPFFDVEAVGKDGAIVHLEVRAASLVRDGALVGRQGIARDISELKRLQAEVAEKSERISLLEDRARIARELYDRVARIAFEPGSAPDDQAIRESLLAVAALKLGLDDTDLRIVEMLSEGRSNPEIAARVHLSANTVKDRVSKLMRLLGARSRAEVVAKAVQRGLIGFPGNP